jgi:hypothetical protein
MAQRDRRVPVDGYRVVTGVALGLSVYSAVSVLPVPPPSPSPVPTDVPTPVGTALAPTWPEDYPAGKVWNDCRRS